MKKLQIYSSYKKGRSIKTRKRILLKEIEDMEIALSRPIQDDNKRTLLQERLGKAMKELKQFGGE